MQVVEKLTPFGKAMVVDDKYIVTRSGDVITFSDAEEIRRIVGKTDKEIAEIYGISRGSVWQIRKGITYARA